MRLSRITATILIVVTVASAGACSSKRGEKLRTGPLFERVQREEGLHGVAAKVTAAVKADPGTSALMAKVDLARFEKRLGEFLCHAAGGPCKYDAKLSDVWAGAALDDEQFEQLMEVVITGMTDADLPQQEQNDLIDLMMKAHEAEG